MSVSLVNSLPIQNVLNGFVFNGEYDNIVNFCEIDISINAEGNYSVQFYFSPDKLDTITSNIESFTYSSSSFTTYKLSPECKYFKLALTATSNISNVMVQTIYKSNLTYSISSGGSITSNVDIVSQSLANLNVLVNNENNINTAIVANGNSSSIWFNDTFTPGKANVVSLNVGQQGFKQISIFGNVAGACNLTIAYSQDGSSWFDSSLGQITFTAAADFSRDWTSSAYYIGIYSDTAVAAEIYYSLQV